MKITRSHSIENCDHARNMAEEHSYKRLSVKECFTLRAIPQMIFMIQRKYLVLNMLGSAIYSEPFWPVTVLNWNGQGSEKSCSKEKDLFSPSN